MRTGVATFLFGYIRCFVVKYFWQNILGSDQSREKVLTTLMLSLLSFFKEMRNFESHTRNDLLELLEHVETQMFTKR